VPKENTQAQHILSAVISEDWLDMDQIREKIKNLFFIEYKHEKSLYPYIKTLVDIGLLETSSVGGKRKWKKKNLVIQNKNFNTHYEQIN
jgi:DNA-binding PadR family transcriptional regulator